MRVCAQRASPLRLSARWAFAFAFFSSACTESLDLIPELAPSTQSLVLFVQAPEHLQAYALNTDGRLQQPIDNTNPVDVFVLEYQAPLKTLGLPEDTLVLVPDNDPKGAPFPDAVRVTETRVEPSDGLQGWFESEPPSFLPSTWFENPSLAQCIESGGCFVKTPKGSARCIHPCSPPSVARPKAPTPPNLDRFPARWRQFVDPIPYRAPWPIESTECRFPEIRTPTRPVCAPISPCNPPFERNFGENAIFVDQSVEVSGPGTKSSPMRTVDPTEGDLFIFEAGEYMVPDFEGPIRLVGRCPDQVKVTFANPEVTERTELERLTLESSPVVYASLELTEVRTRRKVTVEAGGTVTSTRTRFISDIEVREEGYAKFNESRFSASLRVHGEAEVFRCYLRNSGRNHAFSVFQGGRGTASDSYIRGIRAGAVQNRGEVTLRNVVLDGGGIGVGYAQFESSTFAQLQGVVVVRPAAFGMYIRSGLAEDILIVHRPELAQEPTTGLRMGASDKEPATLRRIAIYGADDAGLEILTDQLEPPFLIEDLWIEGVLHRPDSGSFIKAPIHAVNGGQGIIRRAHLEPAPGHEVWVSQPSSILRFEDLTIIDDLMSPSPTIEVVSGAKVELERVHIENARTGLEVRRAETRFQAVDLVVENAAGGLQIEEAEVTLSRFRIGASDFGATVLGSSPFLFDNGIIAGARTGLIFQTEPPPTWQQVHKVTVEDSPVPVFVE